MNKDFVSSSIKRRDIPYNQLTVSEMQKLVGYEAIQGKQLADMEILHQRDSGTEMISAPTLIICIAKNR